MGKNWGENGFFCRAEMTGKRNKNGRLCFESPCSSPRHRLWFPAQKGILPSCFRVSFVLWGTGRQCPETLCGFELYQPTRVLNNFLRTENVSPETTDKSLYQTALCRWSAEFLAIVSSWLELEYNHAQQFQHRPSCTRLRQIHVARWLKKTTYFSLEQNVRLPQHKTVAVG